MPLQFGYEITNTCQKAASMQALMHDSTTRCQVPMTDCMGPGVLGRGAHACSMPAAPALMLRWSSCMRRALMMASPSMPDCAAGPRS